ncbi:TOG array regulator of axonemal microtubules protein 2-like [Strigops habroptila]|uniref:TOG array regulator of axonemal microtubules protein 2-like n=1 Tax=Strigops habroptila TaxID=2489341 RepID=UPI0011CED676|nr:TOG array regulator of axonemal microtubules protein 2-like [Strigops habroptila]
MKKQMSSREGDEAGESPHPRDVSPLDGYISKADGHDLNTVDEDDLPQLSQRALTQDPQKREARSTALETIEIKKNLQTGKMSEDLLGSQRGLTDCSDPKEGTLKSVVSRSPSQRLLVASKPMPPIQKRLPSSEPSRMSNRELEQRKDGRGSDDSDGNKKELMSMPKAWRRTCEPISPDLQHHVGGGMKSDRGLREPIAPLRLPPIQAKEMVHGQQRPRTCEPILPVLQPHVGGGMKSDRGLREPIAPLRLPPIQAKEMVHGQQSNVISAASAPHVGGGMKSDRGLREPIAPLRLPPIQAKEMVHGQQSNVISAASAHHVGGGMKSDGELHEPAAPLHLPHIQAKEMDHLMSPRLQSDDDSKDRSGRIDVTLSTSVQKKINQQQRQQMRAKELLRGKRKKEREKSSQLLPQGIDPGDTAEETMSVLATAPDSVGCGEKSERGDDQEARPFSDAQHGLLSTLTWLSSDDWEEKTKGLFSVRRLAICHSEVLLSRLHDVSLAVTKEVNNLRSKVSLLAINTLGELFRTMQKHMDPVVDEVNRVLLQRMGNCSMSIQKAANQCLGIMVGNVTPARAMTALMASGIHYRSVLVRKCAAEHLLTTMEQIGAQKLLSGSCDRTEVLVRAVVMLAQDCHQDTRCYGRKMLRILMRHQKFEKYLNQSIPSHDLEDLIATIMQKGIEDLKCEAASAKESRDPVNSGQKMPQNNLASDAGLRSGSEVPNLPCQTVHHTSVQAVEETEEFMELCRLLTAEDCQSRLKGVQLLRDHCKSSPWFISTITVQIFGVFVLRIQDCNKKVKQQALEALSWMTSVLRDALHPVLVSLVEAVTDNLNSKHPGISAAAVKALEAFIAQLAMSVPATAPDSVGCGEKSERGDDQEARPFPDAQQGLLSTLTWLSSDDWEEKTKGLFSVRRLAICHSEVLLSRLHDVSLAVTKEVNNLRSKVSLLAISALGELFRTMKKHMDPVVDEATRVLLQRMGNCSMSIQKAANQCLGIMVGNVTPARAMTALMASGIHYRNVLVRKCAAEHLLTTMEQIGAQKLLSGTRYSTEVLVRAVVKLAQDCHQDTRCYGRKMLNILMSHQKFEKYLNQTVPSRDLKDVMAAVRQKGIEDLKCEAASAKESRDPVNSGQKMPQNNLASDAGLRSGSEVPNLPCQTVHHTSVQAVEETEEFMELCRLLTAEDCQSRLKGVQLLRDHCKSSPWFISTITVQIFGVFVLRIQDCNKKVKQQALEALSWMTSVLRDALHPVLVSLVEAVTDNLNSKHPGISAAAVKALEAFIAQLESSEH